jgi:predicted metal-dependent HD superfamily phosphohydrolase
MNMSDIAKLKSEWIEILCQWGDSQKEAIKAFNMLCRCYQSSNRHYHTLAHIRHILWLARKYRSQFDCWNSIYFATWFHDAVQSIGLDNEYESAQLAKDELSKFRVPHNIITKITEMILATKSHERSFDNDTNLFLDFDLVILASKEPAYEEYSNNCRKEYLIPNWLYRKGRTLFLCEKLSQKHIFHTPLMREKFEHQAIRNLEQELASLKGN